MIPTLQTFLTFHSILEIYQLRMIIDLSQSLKHSPEEDQFTHASMLDI